MPLTSDAKAAMEQVASVIRPVSITMLFVVYCVVELCNPYSLDRAGCRSTGSGSALSRIMVYQEAATDSDSTKLGGSLLNAAALVGMMVVITFGMFFLYKYRCMKVIWGYLIFSVGMLLAVFGFIWINQVIQKYAIVMDWVTLGALLLNWAAVGVVSVFGDLFGVATPPKLGQFYLVFISAMMAWILAWMPPWTGWAILIALAFYDIAAVLCPGGPLKLLVEEAQDRQERIPALVYETTMSREDRQALVQPVPQLQQTPPARGEERHDSASEEESECTVETESGTEDQVDLPEPAPERIRDYGSRGQAVGLGLSANDLQPAPRVVPQGGAVNAIADDFDEMPIMRRAPEPLPAERSEQDDGVYEDGVLKLGLGDFVFYSVLVGKGSAYGVATVMASFVAILMGLCMTLCLLAVYEKALPALPFSIFLGVAFVFVIYQLGMPFIMPLSTAGPVFI